MNSIEEILDAMDEELDNAPKLIVPKGKSGIDAAKFRDYIEQIRLCLPNEIRQAQNLVSDRKGIINEAKAEADIIIKRAKEKEQELIKADAITKQAQQVASDITANANANSKKMTKATDAYVDKTLSNLEELLTANILEVRKMLNALRNKNS
ncbi:MAG: ATPase [Ruminiclostridium sp.]|nr:ATPase [Ruminiclostridium sp.]MBQ8932403.1 ATPase [Ruminiclostridium sp.]